MPMAKSETEMRLAEAVSGRATKSTVARADIVPASMPRAPGKQGLYDPRNEHDACGVGFIANLKNESTLR